MDKITENQKTWDLVAHEFFEASALPFWGPFGVGDDLNLISKIKDRTFLEIACGSGRSIKYLIDSGARKVYGVDLSTTQIEEAMRFNAEAVANNRAEFIRGNMEDKFDIEPVDLAFSVYGIGWTQNPEQTFKNIYSYLKPCGQFIWSWDHSLFSDVVYEDGKFIVENQYHDEEPIVLPNWKKKEGATAYLTYRKVSTWFKLLRDAGFQIDGFYEPKPKTLDRGSDDPTKYYAIQKAEKVPCSFIFVCTKPNIEC
jgi:SAM-dependent methyltransferase